MGDLQLCCRQPNGLVLEDHLFPPSFSPPPSPSASSNPDPSSVQDDSWVVAEKTAQEVVCCVQSTIASDKKRDDVIEYVHRLIRCLGCVVVPYGSVPLKTYLPDGDIDLTVISKPNVEDALARDVIAMLQGEEQNKNVEYEVKDTQFIDAEVKLVKCLVNNMVIDISFNQLGGLRTLCFLGQVDRLIGKNNLFKRSIILIKAWCYYESRILGAHHGLISTYALETLVLYIFHVFHSFLNGPLMVLYRFLDYFSTFDWENYCISLNGAVCKASLPDIVVEMPKNGGNNWMLSEEFLRNCVDVFSVPSSETNLRAFPQKHLNIIDPLRKNNNLGRSVHRGNFYRICSAFKYGAHKLGRILLLPRERIADEIKKFFAHTLARHGSKCEADVQNTVVTACANESSTLSSSFHSDSFSEDKMHLKSSNFDIGNNISEMEDKLSVFRNDQDINSMEVISTQVVSETGFLIDGTAVFGYSLDGDASLAIANETSDCSSPVRNDQDRNSMEVISTQIVSETGFLIDGTAVFGYSLGGDASLAIANETSDCSSPSSNFSSSLSEQFHFVPFFYISRFSTECRKFRNRNLFQERATIDERMPFTSRVEHREKDVAVFSCYNNQAGVISSSPPISCPDANISESLPLNIKERDLVGIAGGSETLNSLSDLNGDYDSHIRSLQYGLCCHGYALSAPELTPPTLPSQFQRKKPWDTVRQSMPLMQNSFSRTNTNGVVLHDVKSPVNHPTTSSLAAFSSEGKHKPLGIGTYFPHKNWPSPGRGSKGSRNIGQLQRRTCNNGLAPILSKRNSAEEGSLGSLNSESQAPGPVKSGISRESHMFGNSHANGVPVSSQKFEFGSLGHLEEEYSTSHNWGSTQSLAVQSSKPVSGCNKKKVAGQSYQLKNEDDFPPLPSGCHR
ncbi:uncharacterized protein LOC132269266 [Cornus florida]|uniref:uncharacterized protein LOC132269266 n=1 Tax=Cornus florida TaxID=4283 RepID=UPI00289B7355|nr:uncharacterized protein LOC132269266 [Cornus florida]